MTHPYSQNPISNPLNCHRCGVDLSPLIQIHDQALWYYRQASQALDAGNYPTAITWNNQALALYGNNADFHALAGQLWALQGEFRQAIAAWEKARQINPTHQTTSAYLEELERVIGI
jgi:tetratricopeptide (TPR) repeat protein